MPFIPHTANDTQAMLNTLGIDQIEPLFDEIDPALRASDLNLPPGLSEMEVTRLMQGLANRNASLTCFAGAGAYDHYIAASAWDIALRGEFYSAYTPYQAEGSQGTLQLIYEFQTLIARLTGLQAANASLYDGATAVAEAVLMACRIQKKEKTRTILIPKSLLTAYRQALSTATQAQGIRLIELDWDRQNGQLDVSHQAFDEAFTALVLPQVNGFGQLEDVHHWTNWAHSKGALVIALTNPLLASVLVPAGQWGDQGADIAVGEGQVLGLPLSYGGPYYGFMATKLDYVRQMPGRLVGKTNDLDGNEGYALTLQAREQHIRRGKATSNICSNQGLMVTASTIHMALMGQQGLINAAQHSLANHRQLVTKLCGIPGVNPLFTSGHFGYESVLCLPMPASTFIERMAQQGILAGVAMAEWGNHNDTLTNALWIATTEQRTSADIHAYHQHAQTILESAS